MNNTTKIGALLASASLIALTQSAFAESFNIPSGDLDTALEAYTAQSGVPLVVSNDAVRGIRSSGAKGNLSSPDALWRILRGTGFVPSRNPSGVIEIVRQQHSSTETQSVPAIQLAQATPAPRASVETVTVTSSKLGGADVQSIPIAITALSQEQLTATQTAGGPDLVKQVPNLTFTKTNFTGYSIQVRGIGTQAISVATDPAVAVAFNDTPFIRNHFFEQEFYDLSQVEVLRGPQGTLYGRNATAGVVNITSAKPTDQFEAMASADIGNYKNRRFEGMINIPFVSDKLDLRIAGEWTKRDGYTYNETNNSQTDGRDLWSTRVTLGWKPTSTIQTYLIWEHFNENDDRIRSAKQLCKNDPGISEFSIPNGTVHVDSPRESVFDITSATFSQGCLPSSLYAPEAFEVPNGFSLPFISGAAFEGLINSQRDPYLQTFQSTNLRNIQSEIDPKYLAKNDTIEFNTTWNIVPSLTLYADTGYNSDFLWSTEDYNRFDTAPGIFVAGSKGFLQPNGHYTCYLSGEYVTDPAQCVDQGAIPAATFCDHQLGCSDRLVVQDLSTEHAWQFSQELRLASDFQGPLNFSVGGNYLHYETEENYYVFSNTFTMISLNQVNCSNDYTQNVTDHLYCLSNGKGYFAPEAGGGIPTESPQYLDPNPISSLNNEGHNYFLSQNPYTLNSYAAFGEAYYKLTDDLKLTGGLRWTDDQKRFPEIPSQLLTRGYGYPSTGAVNQSWKKFTGRAVANWTPKLDFTDQTLVYASFAHGYKAGGANPPGPVLLQYTDTIAFPVHPLTFKPEYVNAYEAGTKNTLLDGAVTLNGDVFYYDYKGYQISQIVDRSAINLNFDASIKGAELEATWEPLPGFKLSFAGGYETTRINDGQQAIDLIDRTAGHSDWVVMKPFVGQSSNCIVPTYVAAALVVQYYQYGEGNQGPQTCGIAYNAGLDPITLQTYQYGVSNGLYPYTVHRDFYPDLPTIIYPGFDPASAPNNGEGFTKNLGGNELPNAPHYTMSLSADYTLPVSSDWAATLHGDFYWQADSWARVFNDNPYDRIHGYTNLNLALIVTDASGWQFMGYVKNVFDTTAITGDFLNSDDSGLTTNIFLTDPRLFGVRLTKHFDGSGLPSGALPFLDSDTKPQLWMQLGGNFNASLDDRTNPYDPTGAQFFPNGGGPTPNWPAGLPTPAQLQKTPDSGFDWQGVLFFQPEDSDWVLKAGIRYGRSSRNKHFHKSVPAGTKQGISFFGRYYPCSFIAAYYPQSAAACYHGYWNEFDDSHNTSGEQHTMLDFTLGKDVGLGTFGEGSTGVIGAGIRIAQFESQSTLDLGADPNYHLVADVFQKYHETWEFTSNERRSFHGIGPQVTWDASHPVWGDVDEGQITLDWGVNLSVLFGKQKALLHHTIRHCRHTGFGELAACDGGSIFGDNTEIVEPADDIDRSRTVTVPNIGGYLGASMRYHNGKVSLGYRADTFFDAMDGGEQTAKSYSRGFYGPYLNVSLGL
ncbi:MAG TPA: TonB-dependent receptor [Rhizomicrobium sp.]|nr:TonB-dependent receptor [Rhizomicrobium sp.]